MTVRSTDCEEWAGIYAERMAEKGWTLADVLEDWAHGLAEEIRNQIGPENIPGESADIKRVVKFGRAMADLIDPEVN